MFVTYKCENCGSDVNSNMELCSKCGAELPVMTLERDYDTEVDEELYELEHPIRTRIRKMLGTYGEHLGTVIEQEAEVEESVGREVEKVKAEKGKAAARWYRFKHESLLLFVAIGIIAVIVAIGIFIDTIEDEQTAYITWGLLSLVPLYIVSLWLLIKRDYRELSLKRKILQHALGAFNKLAFSILYVALILYAITSINKFFFPY